MSVFRHICTYVTGVVILVAGCGSGDKEAVVEAQTLCQDESNINVVHKQLSVLFDIST